jgi:effector-binding domain-containing protein
MATFEDLEHTEVEAPSVLAVQLSSRSKSEPASIAEAMGAAFGSLITFIQMHELVPSGPPRAIYTAFDAENTTFTVAFPIAEPLGELPEADPATISRIPGGKTLRFTHHGPYHELMTTYNRITQFMVAKGLMTSEADWERYMPMWEEYVNDPAQTPEADLLTYIHVPLP